MDEIIRKMTFEEEYEILQKQTRKVFAKEIKGCETPFVNCVLRTALRCIRKLLAKYKVYEDLEEQGLLFRLPCKVGDTVYEIHPLTGRITPRKITSILIKKAPNTTVFYKTGQYGYLIDQNDFDKTVFLTSEEAEAKLKKMRESEE